MKCKTVALGEIFKITSGGTPSRKNEDYFKDGEIPWVKTGDLKTKYLYATSENINKLGIENSSAKVFPKKTVLLAMYGATIGSCSILGIESATNQACAAFIPNEHVTSEYLYYYLLSIKEFLIRSGVGGAQPNISASMLKQIPITLPPHKAQKKIATVLDKAQELINKRKEQLAKLDEFVQSVFLEMFGDPVMNAKGWPTETLEKACKEIYRYPTFYGFEYISLGVPVVRIGNILLSGEVDPVTDNYVCISPAISNKYPRTILELNDILMAVRGDGSTGKRIGIVTSPNLIGANISPNLLRFSCNVEMLEPRYFFYFITSDSGQNIISRYISRTAKKTITAQNLKTIKIPLPPIQLQNKFAAIVEKTEQQKALMQQSLTEMENNFNSLMQQAFKGELF